MWFDHPADDAKIIHMAMSQKDPKSFDLEPFYIVSRRLSTAINLTGNGKSQRAVANIANVEIAELTSFQEI